MSELGDGDAAVGVAIDGAEHLARVRRARGEDRAQLRLEVVDARLVHGAGLARGRSRGVRLSLVLERAPLLRLQRRALPRLVRARGTDLGLARREEARRVQIGLAQHEPAAVQVDVRACVEVVQRVLPGAVRQRLRQRRAAPLEE